MCVAYLHIPFTCFWDMSPIEVDFALTSYFKQVESDNHISWEQTRTSIYFAYLFTPSRRRKVSYNTFKKDFLPFHFDSDEDQEPKVVIDDDAFATMHEFMKQREGTQ